MYLLYWNVHQQSVQELCMGSRCKEYKDSKNDHADVLLINRTTRQLVIV